ncbi:tRNA (N6-threonylcarbamoyladenosine(37)-N6)-methyltransferase TrmO [Tropicimonas sp. S265A]|uniref:tRNA (N6-threonylcarbamoyladenosine(37)-N6)-methyltransferase TrmO n=1 Tax=Tropicimonas sp. S265A TaxID=3415134 RepID=UPI003C7DFC1C
MGDPRPGETVLPFDPANSADDTVAFIGTIRSPWGKEDCPKNIGRARETGQGAHIELTEGYGPGLQGLSVGQAIVLLYWMDRTRRDIIVQRPRHVDGPRGVFALRSPARPNPIAMCTVRITELDPEAGRIGIDAIDVYDGTPLVDLKPWLETVDIPPAAKDPL